MGSITQTKKTTRTKRVLNRPANATRKRRVKKTRF